MKLFSEGSNTTLAVVSKCPGDRTAPNDPQANQRKGDPRKLYFSLDFKLFTVLELLEAGILSSSAIGPGPRASKCPGDWTGPKKLQVGRRKGDPRKLTFH